MKNRFMFSIVIYLMLFIGCTSHKQFKDETMSFNTENKLVITDNRIIKFIKEYVNFYQTRNKGKRIGYFQAILNNTDTSISVSATFAESQSYFIFSLPIGSSIIGVDTVFIYQKSRKVFNIDTSSLFVKDIIHKRNRLINDVMSDGWTYNKNYKITKMGIMGGPTWTLTLFDNKDSAYVKKEGRHPFEPYIPHRPFEAAKTFTTLDNRSL